MYFFNGHLYPHSTLEISVDHPALLYGASVFTTLRVYKTLEARLTQWPAHCHRLAQSLASFGWPIPDWAEVQAGAQAMLEARESHSSMGFAVLRITVFPDGGVLITGRALPEDLQQRQQQGIIAWVANSMETGVAWSRSLTGHKTGNYLAPWLALQQLPSLTTPGRASHHPQEAILINSQGDWLETCTGNLWGWSQGRWYTPPSDSGILPGITQAAVRQDLQARGLEVIETAWQQPLIETFQTLAYTNCVVEVVPIQEVNLVMTTPALSGWQRLKYDPQHPALRDLRHFFLETDAE